MIRYWTEVPSLPKSCRWILERRTVSKLTKDHFARKSCFIHHMKSLCKSNLLQVNTLQHQTPKMHLQFCKVLWDCCCCSWRHCPFIHRANATVAHSSVILWSCWSLWGGLIDFCSYQNKLIHAVVSIVLTCEFQIPLDVSEVCWRPAAALVLLPPPTFSLFKDKHGVLLCRGRQSLGEKERATCKSAFFYSRWNKNRGKETDLL